MAASFLRPFGAQPPHREALRIDSACCCRVLFRLNPGFLEICIPPYPKPCLSGVRGDSLGGGWTLRGGKSGRHLSRKPPKWGSRKTAARLCAHLGACLGKSPTLRIPRKIQARLIVFFSLGGLGFGPGPIGTSPFPCLSLLTASRLPVGVSRRAERSSWTPPDAKTSQSANVTHLPHENHVFRVTEGSNSETLATLAPLRRRCHSVRGSLALFFHVFAGLRFGPLHLG